MVLRKPLLLCVLLFTKSQLLSGSDKEGLKGWTRLHTWSGLLVVLGNLLSHIITIVFIVWALTLSLLPPW